MHNPTQQFGQSSIVFEKPGILSENLKTFPAYQCLEKSVRDFFLFCLDLELFAKIKKTCFYTLFFYIFINNSRSKKNLKNSKHTFFRHY